MPFFIKNRADTASALKLDRVVQEGIKQDFYFNKLKLTAYNLKGKNRSFNIYEG